MGIEGGGGRRIVSQILLDEAQVHAGLEEMGGIAVPKRMNRSPLHDATGVEGRPKSILHTVSGYGVCGGGHADTPPTRSRKDPHGIAVGFPILAEQLEGALGQRHIAVFGAFAVAHVDEHPCTVTIGDLQVSTLLKAQTTRVKSRQANARAGPRQVGQNGSHLFDTEDSWEFLFPWGSDEGQCGPLPLQGVLVKERDATKSNGARATGRVLDILEGEEVLTSCFLSDGGGGLMIVLGKLPNGPDRHLLGALGQAAELQILDHPCSEFGHGYTSCV